MNVRYNKIIPSSFVDGPGQRTVIFLQGCTLACPGCQNRHIWPADGGQSIDIRELAQAAALYSTPHGQVTISGGEPFQQPDALYELVQRLRDAGVQHILVYTGYTWEQLFDDKSNPAFLWKHDIMKRIDVLVDGAFIREQDDPFLAWRGSRNQRPIDVPASLQTHNWDPVILDWNSPEIVLTPTGDAFLPIGLAPQFSDLGATVNSRRCGQTR